MHNYCCSNIEQSSSINIAVCGPIDHHHCPYCLCCSCCWCWLCLHWPPLAAAASKLTDEKGDFEDSRCYQGWAWPEMVVMGVKVMVMVAMWLLHGLSRVLAYWIWEKMEAACVMTMVLLLLLLLLEKKRVHRHHHWWVGGMVPLNQPQTCARHYHHHHSLLLLPLHAVAFRQLRLAMTEG